MHQLQDLISTFESSFGGSQEQRSAEADIAPVVDAIIEPAMQLCTQSSGLLADGRFACLLTMSKSLLCMLCRCNYSTCYTLSACCVNAQHSLMQNLSEQSRCASMISDTSFDRQSCYTLQVSHIDSSSSHMHSACAVALVLASRLS